MDEKFFLIERVKDCFATEPFNYSVLQCSNGELTNLSESINSKVKGIKYCNGKIFCENGFYEIREINERTAKKTIDDLKRSYILSQKTGVENRL